MKRLALILSLVTLAGCQSQDSEEVSDGTSSDGGAVTELTIESGELTSYSVDPADESESPGFQFSLSDDSTNNEVERPTEGERSTEVAEVDNSIEARMRRATKLEVAFDYDGAVAEWNEILDIVRKEHGDQSWHARDIELAIEGVAFRSQLDLEARTKMVELSSLERNALLKSIQGDQIATLRYRDQAVTLAREIFPEESIAVANCLLAKAYAHSGVGQEIEAVRLVDEVLLIREKLFGKSHPSYYSALRALGLIYQKNLQFEDAEALLSEATALCGDAEGHAGDRYAMFLNDHGVSLNQLQQFDKAEPVLVQSTAIRERLYGENDVRFAYSLRNLSIVYMSLNRDQQAIDGFTKSLSIFESTLGPANGITLDTMTQLATMFVKTQDSPTAEQLFRTIERQYAVNPGENHPVYATTLFKLAVTLGNQGKYEEADPMFVKAATIQEATLGPASPELAQTLSTYSVLLQRTGRTQEAAQIQSRVNAIARQPENGPVNRY